MEMENKPVCFVELKKHASICKYTKKVLRRNMSRMRNASPSYDINTSVQRKTRRVNSEVKEFP